MSEKPIYERYFNYGWWIGLISGLLVAATFFFTSPACAGDWSIAIPVASYHLERDFECNGIERAYNEDNAGLTVRYRLLVIGRFENSHSGCNGAKYSNLIGIEDHLARRWGVDWSITAAVADGYAVDGRDTSDGYRGWASLNAKVGPVKIWYSYYVTAIGLQVDF